MIAVLAAALSGCGLVNAQEPERLPVPTFSESSSATASAGDGVVDEGLPDDCATLLSADDFAALGAQPVGSVTLRTVRGIPEPSVNRTERVACSYSGTAGPAKARKLLDLNVGRYTDATAASKQWTLNTAAERDGSPSRDLVLGSASAVLIERRTESVLAVVYGIDTLTFILPAQEPVAGKAPGDRLVDLALRVLPKVGATQPAPPPVTTPPPGPAIPASDGTRAPGPSAVAAENR
ncbi:MAG: hypothetical protein OJJ54_21695 [Pseudonocardia sp.]|nr:hypothetical protein [Pseudonocardia sp.]